VALFRKREEPPRPPVADLSSAIEVDGRSLTLGDVLIGARVDRGRLSVEVHHPTFPELSDPTRLVAAQEVLVAALGETGMRQVVHQLTAATHSPIDSFSLESLRSFARSLGAAVDPPPPTGPS
jgi:hypothetical protein